MFEIKVVSLYFKICSLEDASGGVCVKVFIAQICRRHTYLLIMNQLLFPFHMWTHSITLLYVEWLVYANDFTSDNTYG